MLSEFNLIVSTTRDYESQCENEVWFNLNALGDSSPIVSRPGIPGLILVKTTVAARRFVAYLREYMLQDPDYIQFILKVYPIDVVVETDLEMIQQATVNLVQTHPYAQDPSKKYRVTIRKRQCELTTDQLIAKIASQIPHAVSLKQYDWILEVEIVNRFTGLAILKDEEIFQPIREKRLTGTELEKKPEID